MLLKLNPGITKLALYDIVHTPGVAADLSHVESVADVKGFVGKEGLEASLEGSEIVVIPAGVPRKPGMTRDDLFNTNASIVATICQAAAKVFLTLLPPDCQTDLNTIAGLPQCHDCHHL